MSAKKTRTSRSISFGRVNKPKNKILGWPRCYACSARHQKKDWWETIRNFLF